ncbi:hypothetical protein N658DRAFT_270835 [Parathielavia hyrcaniae]|uniref:Uncharacterized protein n=1 Tax=Parathielavia hyrcaniae TaxID=113614 RepID=A0AAN6SXK8_9PEZI|nr:hypothetical protein N658DRAFT_270835 [Parathielavia hyrcaniae]
MTKVSIYRKEHNVRPGGHSLRTATWTITMRASTWKSSGITDLLEALVQPLQNSLKRVYLLMRQFTVCRWSFVTLSQLGFLDSLCFEVRADGIQQSPENQLVASDLVISQGVEAEARQRRAEPRFGTGASRRCLSYCQLSRQMWPMIGHNMSSTYRIMIESLLGSANSNIHQVFTSKHV